MSFILYPWQLLLVILAGWVNREQQQIIDFQRTEIEILKEKAGEETAHPERRPATKFGGQG